MVGQRRLPMASPRIVRNIQPDVHRRLHNLEQYIIEHWNSYGLVMCDVVHSQPKERGKTGDINNAFDDHEFITGGDREPNQQLPVTEMQWKLKKKRNWMFWVCAAKKICNHRGKHSPRRVKKRVREREERTNEVCRLNLSRAFRLGCRTNTWNPCLSQIRISAATGSKHHSRSLCTT